MYYERHLPHWQPDGAALFVTWRLHGSLPKHVLVPQDEMGAGRAFVEFDRILDKAAYGPVWLKQPEIAKSVLEALRFGETDLHLYKLQAFVVMANHVHVLIQPMTDLPKISRAIKGFTARECNRVLNRSEQPFWHDEFYDRWIRDEGGFNRVTRYIERNPVAAGLANCIEDYPWSSACQKA